MEEGEEEEETEREREILDALRKLPTSKAATVADFIGQDRGNTSNRLAKLWKAGKVRKEVIDNVAHYYLRERLINEIDVIQPTQATHPTQEGV